MTLLIVILPLHFASIFVFLIFILRYRCLFSLLDFFLFINVHYTAVHIDDVPFYQLS